MTGLQSVQTDRRKNRQTDASTIRRAKHSRRHSTNAADAADARKTPNKVNQRRNARKYAMNATVAAHASVAAAKTQE